MVRSALVAGLPVPKTSLLPNNAVPKSFTTPPTSPSTIPFPPAHPVPVAPTCVVCIQYSMVKSSDIVRGILTKSFDPSKRNAFPEVVPNQNAFLLTEKSGLVRVTAPDAPVPTTAFITVSDNTFT